MGFVLALRELSRRRLLLAIGVAFAALAAFASVHRGSTLRYSSASTQVLVDSQSSVLGNDAQSFEPLAERAAVYANFMTSPVVLDLIGQQVGLSGDQIYAAGPVNANEPRVEQEPTALKRNVQITGETKPYRLSFEGGSNVPTIDIYAQAPTTHMAISLADAAAVGMQQYVTEVETKDHVPPVAQVVIRQLGPATGGVVDATISKSLAVMTFAAVFVLWCALLLAMPRARAMWRETGALSADGAGDGTETDSERIIDPEGVETVPQGVPRARERAVFEAAPRLVDDRPAVPARSAR